MAHYWFVSTNNRLSRLALLTFLLAFLVIILGAYTRLTNAGLSCPDWPHCYGFITAPHTSDQMISATERYPTFPVNVKKAWTEMTHRYFAGTEGMLIVLLAFSVLLGSKARDTRTKSISFALMILLCTQVMLGMLTVTEKLRPAIVLSHLLTGIAILGLLWWAYLSLRQQKRMFYNASSKQFSRWLWIALFIVAIQITLGGWVSSHSAGLACVDLPYCNGKWLPAIKWQQLNTDLISIHMLHRIGAVITAFYLFWLGHILLRRPNFRLLGGTLLILITLQIFLGVLTILWLRPVSVALLHQMTATLILLTVITALVKVSYVKDTRYASWST